MFRILCSLACAGALAFVAPPCVGQENTTPWHSYFQHEVDHIRAQTLHDLEAITPDNWQATQRQWREQLQEMLGLAPWPERTDLQATSVGSIAVEGVNIDRLHYQSRPGLYVAANLYKPDFGEPPEAGWPAVLYVCGHARVTSHGRLLGNKTSYQHHGLWLARHGVVCLIVDTIQLGEFHGEHHGTYKLGRWDWISRGYTPAGVEAWNAIRGIDLLQSLAYVDGDRIGITGRSGGGAYSWFAAALDDRIRVAVPVAGITDLENHVIDGCVEGHCDCMYFVNFHRWDYTKLAALVAPRPLLLANSDSDGIFPLDGVMRTHEQLAALYRKLGHANDYGVLIAPGPHKDTQELQVGAFKWLLRALTSTEPVIDTAALKELDAPELAVFGAETPRGERVTSVSSWFVDRMDSVATADVDKPAAKRWKTTWLPELQRLGILPAAALKPLDFESVASGRDAQRDWELFEWEALGDAAIQVLRVDGQSAQPAVVRMLSSPNSRWDEQSAAASVAGGEIAQALMVFPDRTHYFVRPRGSDWLARVDSPREAEQRVRRFALLGQSPDWLALHDLLAAVTWVAGREDVASGMELMGLERAAPLVTLAALWLHVHAPEPELLRALRVSPFSADPLLAPIFPGYLRVCDFDDLRAAAAEYFEVHEMDAPSQLPELLVDTAAAPQQATGMRIVEVQPDSALIWVRATRWPLANLGDLPEVEFEQPAEKGKQNQNPILPAQGVDGLRFAVPGVAAQVRVGYRRAGEAWQYSSWEKVDADSDFSRLVPISGLTPATRYELRTEVRGLHSDRGPSSGLSGSFSTLPSIEALPGFRLAVGTCQAFGDRDGPHGFDMYRTMLERDTNAFVMAGDVVYYDALARSRQLAYYHWQRTYALPTLVEFHRRVPTFFLKDDHDTYVNDSWSGDYRSWTGNFTFQDGQHIFAQQTGLPEPAYRTFRIGSDLQIWLMEGRDYRTANTAADGPEKSIWGATQKAWLKETVQQSTARFRVVISPTPIVGPDRENKKDNHSNRVFATEGREVREFLAAQPNTVVVCGDRHWQFHSVDPESGLHEFSVGPASDRHAGGWKAEDFRPDIHQFLRVGGGYLEIELAGPPDARELTLRHLDTRGIEHHSHVLK